MKHIDVEYLDLVDGDIVYPLSTATGAPMALTGAGEYGVMFEKGITTYIKIPTPEIVNLIADYEIVPRLLNGTGLVITGYEVGEASIDIEIYPLDTKIVPMSAPFLRLRIQDRIRARKLQLPEGTKKI
jgi:hypothetical protein